MCRGVLGLVARLAGCASIAAACGGCSLSFPIASMKPGYDEITGSIRPVGGTLPDEEDRRRAAAALSTAMDPQGNGTSVRWENPTTGNKGAFTPVGNAYPTESRVCRAFIETRTKDRGETTMQGTACTVAAGEWVVSDMKLFKKS